MDNSTAAYVRDNTSRLRCPPSSAEPRFKPDASAYANMTRLNHDKSAYKHNLRQSIGPAQYQASTPLPHCVECFAKDPRVRHARGGNAKCRDRPLVDVDSELRGFTRRASNNPMEQYLPEGFPGPRKPFCELEAQLPCPDEVLTSEDTRLSNPPINMRGTENGFNRWAWLCQDPQERVEMPFDAQVDSRLVAKDNHRPNVPVPVDPTLALPGHKDDDRPIYDLEASLARCRRMHDMTTASDAGGYEACRV